MRLIDADVVLENIEEWIDCVGTAYIGKGLSYYNELLGCIDDAPTVDAEPMRHGKWKHYPDCGTTRCSECGWSIEECWHSNFCPYCGAKLDLEG